MLVYVINKNGNPLMPAKPAKARKLLRSGNAKVVNRCPFTIKLKWDCEENVQEVTVGLDKGSRITGVSGVANGQILMSGEIYHRTDIKYNMDARRANRRNRRTRKWYRPKRFLNRASSKRSRRLPPSIKANVEEVIRVVRKIPLPISHIVVEDVQVDIARLNNPDLQGKEYQKSNRLDENLRIATLMRDGYECTKCKKKNTHFDAHHIVWKEHGGKDTIDNLITLCKSCHRKVHQGKKKLDIKGVSGFKDIIAQRTMQGKAYLDETLSQLASLSKVFGFKTSEYRKSLSLPKTHFIDALCVATLETGEVIPPNSENFYLIKFRPRQTRRQFHDLPRKGVGRVRYQVNAFLEGFCKGDIVLVKRKWVKQINSIYSNGYLAFSRVKGSPNVAKPKDLKLLKRGQTVIWEKSIPFNERV
ncbi:hypothetical protein FJZ31_05915 [Candidatus Poribacteria bacterium]|nr:hypothetical protein [Candidatus Poribacteria bacterium]